MSFLLKGALIEYSVGLGASIPNIVIFQFNPESITRTLEVPARTSGNAARETQQAGDIPVERITLTAQFTTHEPGTRLKALSLAVGIGPQLAALEKMARPHSKDNLLDVIVDKVGEALSNAASQPSQNVPREAYPRLLFIWGATRVLPVTIDSMSIVEKQYDSLLNPTLADVNLTLTAIIPDRCSDDPVAKGAYRYSSYARDALAAANPIENAVQILDLINF